LLKELLTNYIHAVLYEVDELGQPSIGVDYEIQLIQLILQVPQIPIAGQRPEKPNSLSQ